MMLIKKVICHLRGHAVINPTIINDHVTRFQCSRCFGDFALNSRIDGALLDWDEVKELYEK